MGKVKSRIKKTLTQSVSNRSSRLYYTTFSSVSKINIAKFQKINISKKKNGVIVHDHHTQRNKYKETTNYGYLIELYISIVILRIFFKYVKKFYEMTWIVQN